MLRNQQRSNPKDKRNRKIAASRLPSNNIGISNFRAPWSVGTPLNTIGLPDRFDCTLKYCETYTFSGSASPAAQVWALNSAFDPNLTGAGHQPSFYDTLQAVYSRYYVEAFKVEVQLSNHTSTVSVFGTLNYSDTNVSTSTVEALSEAHYSQPFVLANQGSGGSSLDVKLPWMATRQLMGTPFTEADDNMYAAVSASPADLAFGILKLSADDTVTTIVVLAKVSIYMRIRFKDLLPLVSS